MIMIGVALNFWSGVTSISNLYHGSYYLTTRDALGCVVADSIYLPEPDPLYVSAQEILRATCYGASTGSAYALAVGGTPGYTFTWFNNIGPGPFSYDDSIVVTTLFAGLETVQVEDSRGCIATDTVMINQPGFIRS